MASLPAYQVSAGAKGRSAQGHPEAAAGPEQPQGRQPEEGQTQRTQSKGFFDFGGEGLSEDPRQPGNVFQSVYPPVRGCVRSLVLPLSKGELEGVT